MILRYLSKYSSNIVCFKNLTFNHHFRGTHFSYTNIQPKQVKITCEDNNSCQDKYLYNFHFLIITFRYMHIPNNFI